MMGLLLFLWAFSLLVSTPLSGCPIPVPSGAVSWRAGRWAGIGKGDFDPYEHVRAGKRALEDGRSLDAYGHFRKALMHDLSSTAILELILGQLGDDLDARTLWSLVWYGLAGDREGHARPGLAAKALLVEDDPFPTRIAVARAKAVKELSEFASNRREEGDAYPSAWLIAWWAERLSFEIAGPSPALVKAFIDQPNLRLAVPDTIHRPVIKALEQVLKQALSNQRTGEAVRAARCLCGLGNQGGFKDLKGKRPGGMDACRRAGRTGIRRAREQLRKKIGDPWTVEELEWLTKEEGEKFTRDHAGFANPGVALSRENRYRIETDCGFETLLGVAETVEDHHHRLVNWFGQDPFEGRQGIIRIVPEASGLEAEGAPFWWVGGFQGGDVTVLRLSCGTIEGLGRGITHELTHRFDGAIYPGMPAWLLEGRAVWTGSAYGSSSDASFVPNHCNLGTVENAYIKGYGGRKKLTELIEGKIEDFRDNYVAGYALYIYLFTGEEEGQKIYADRLEAFMRGCAKHHGSATKAWFVKNFADGKEGRPAGLEAFAEAFHTFISGFYWKNRKPWAKRYTQKTPPGGDARYVYDESTWTWARVRAEPFFGQEQALEAGIFLRDMGREKEAARALVWALSADSPSPAVARILAGLLKGINRKDAAWVMEHTVVFPSTERVKPAPFLARLRQTRRFMAELEDGLATYREKGLVHSAAVLNADRNRIASWLGVPPKDPVPLSEVKVLFPFDENPRHAGLEGWREADLTGYEEHRRPNLWYVTDHGDLHVGRRKPRKGTGRLDRAAHLRHAFALGSRWLLPGAYRITARITFTTSFVAGAVVFGYARRDLNLRFQFSAGDLMYAIGESEDKPKFESVHWRLNGLRQRDGALAGSQPRGTFEFDRAMPAFDLELLVEGATVEAFINGVPLGTYHTADGAPIEGLLGFASGYGAYIARIPMVQRLDRSRLARLPGLLPACLDLGLDRSRPFKQLINLPVLGLPDSTNGQVLIWIPMPWLPDGGAPDPKSILDRGHRAVAKISELMERKTCPQPLIVAVPAALGVDRIETFRKEMESDFEKPPRVVTHPFPASIGTPDPMTPDQNQQWLFFVDSVGVIRQVLPLVTLMFERDLEGDILHWLTVFRDHGRPVRDLHDYSRALEEDLEED